MEDKKKTISDAERTQLFQKYKETKDRNILNELFEKHLYLAENMAKKISDNHYDGNFEEAYVVAQEGLFHAILNYDVNKGRFLVYAYKCISGYLMTQRREVTENVNKYLIAAILKTKLLVEEKYQEKLSENGENYDKIVEEITQILYRENVCREKYDHRRGKMTEYEVKELININNCISLEEADISTLSSDCEIIYAAVEYGFLRQEVENFINEILNEKEKYVIRQRYGFDDGQPKTLKEVGEKLGMTGEAVRQTEAKALRKLAPRFKRRGFKEFL